jgi:hypothetical protein
MKQIYLDDNGKPAGPYPLDQIQEFLRDNIITPDHLASESAEGPWKSLRELGLVAVSQIAPAPGSSLPAPQPVPVATPGFDPMQWVSGQSPLALASVICGVLMILPLIFWVAWIGAIACGYLALQQIKKSPSLRGKNLAIAGIALGGINLVLCVISIAMVFLGSQLSGKYEGTLTNIEFRDGKAYVDVFGNVLQENYSASRNEVVLHAQQGDIVLTRNPDGSLTGMNDTFRPVNSGGWANANNQSSSPPSYSPYGAAVPMATTGVSCCGAVAGLYLFVILFMLAGVGLVIYLAIWVNKDAKARGMDNPTLWVLLIVFTQLLGLIIYLCVRPQGRLVVCSYCQNNRLETLTPCPHCGNP